ncbi:MAG TPA: biopolymer transporter ExbD [Steroidobacteraceae bacterium]|jgi:biopolymer transport protein ExbD|nr:biopolymer transporter ExbD [Steroidobacteraceae bacterium]
MAMSSGTAPGAVMCDINTTPLIDVMLVLLVTLIISLPVMTHAVKLDMPNPNQPPPQNPTPPEVIDLEIDSDGTIAWNGSTISGVDALDGYFHQEAVKDPQPEIHLRPEARAKYGVVARVLAAAQRNHMQKIGFTNVAEYGY